ncbi:hypothetical protein HTVC027P_gp41 [Pelagibacter phage HTVC027P]|nr:hypothetical protein HTVC027P_gp41 [Pelagibacter phage HTVC027P]
MGPYKTINAAFNALKKGFKKQTKRDPNPIEEQMIMEEAKTKITSQGENISTLDTGIMTQASGIKEAPKIKGGIIQDNVEEVSFAPGMDKKGKVIKESPSQKEKAADLDRPFVTDEEMSAFTLEDNARKLNKAKGMIDKLGAQNTKQKLFVADLVEDAGQGIFDSVDMGAVVRSNMYDDLIEQGIDEDVLMDVMYSGTKSDDFGITMAKIKSNAQDKGIDINETVDFYERSFEEVFKPKKADGGRIGYSIGSLPKGIQALVGLINKKFGKGAVKTADEMDRPKNVKEFEDFETRNPNPKRQLTDDEIKFYEEELGDSETWMNDGTVGEAEKALKDRREYIADMELEYKKGNLNPGPGEKGRKEFLESKLEDMEMSGDKKLMTVDEIEELSNFDLQSEMDVAKSLAPKMVERLKLKERFPGLDDELVERILIDDNPQRKAEVIATIEESYKMLEKGMQPEDIISTFKNTPRSKNASGGLPHILGV